MKRSQGGETFFLLSVQGTVCHSLEKHIAPTSIDLDGDLCIICDSYQQNKAGSLQQCMFFWTFSDRKLDGHTLQ